MTAIPTIEELWRALRSAGHKTLQRRVNATHPLDLYVAFEPPDRPGFIAVCGTKPPLIRPLRSVTIEDGHRADGRWSLRLTLDEPKLLPVFATLCHDIADYTREGVTEAQLAQAIAARLDHWRRLFERDSSGLSEAELRGLIGELAVLERLLDTLASHEAIAAWTGPIGTPQDFLLPSGQRIEVKAARRDARTVRINGLAQLDPGNDPLDLAVVRMEDTGLNAEGATTASALIARIEARLAADPDALTTFRVSLAFAGWQENARQSTVVVRVLTIERYGVDHSFPRLTRATVPTGIQDADYTIGLPADQHISAEINR
jgi:Putative  PD-(D/E)XK family member, (DUF4420)